MAKRAKRLTRDELAGMSHSELATVKTKRRLMASLPETESKPKPKQSADDENPTPKQRIERGHRQREGGNDGGE